MIHRRIDDDFLDHLVFRKDSLLGVPRHRERLPAGAMSPSRTPSAPAWRDDKAVYALVPKMIKYYLDQGTILPNVTTYLGIDPKECDHILNNLPESNVVKAREQIRRLRHAHGTKFHEEEQAEFAKRIAANPRNYIAQPVLQLSRHPVFVDDPSKAATSTSALRPLR